MLSDGRLDGATLVGSFKDAGIGAVEPMLGWMLNEPAKWQALRTAVQDAGLGFSCLDVGVNLVGESEADRAKAQDTVAQGVEAARSLGCPLVLLAGSKAAAGLGDAASRRLYGQGQ